VRTPQPETAADQIAAILLSGATGLKLMGRLRVECHSAGREDYILGVAMAVSIFEADRVGLLADLHQARATINQLRGGVKA
jgi:hypothetical protein